MIKIVAIIALIVFLLVVGPFLVIWSWNVLFGPLYTIAYTFETWCAIVLLGAFFRANVTVNRKD